MVTICFQRATEDEPDVTIMDVPRDGKTLADMVQERIESGSTVMTDEHTAYKSLKGRGYDRHTIRHGEGEMGGSTVRLVESGGVQPVRISGLLVA
ncbi:MAG: transposase [Nitrosopumilaceae archaeon]|nr:transposase [Nitrosopumilaceae archaeon]